MATSSNVYSWAELATSEPRPPDGIEHAYVKRDFPISIRLSWDKQPDTSSYHIEYAPVGEPSAKRFKLDTSDSQITVDDLRK